MVTVSHETGKKIHEILESHGKKKALLVCDPAFDKIVLHDEISFSDISLVRFSDFTPNPKYEDVCKGVDLFNSENCDSIIAVGGGSSIDVAKCIKLYSKMDPSVNYLEQEYVKNNILFIAVPTTSGTGSESTRYAVIYYNGKKQSVSSVDAIPDYAILDSRVLSTLPLYQKKCTAMDALCQGIESWWSVNADDESRKLSEKAVEMIKKNLDAYLANTDDGNEKMMIAANYAGRAINITQTTAAHAMSYKLTSLYGIPHVRAAFTCLPYVWEFMNFKVSDSELEKTFSDIANALGFERTEEAISWLKQLYDKLFEDRKVSVKAEDLELLTSSVNPVRLKNNPVRLKEPDLRKIYSTVISEAGIL